MFRGIDRELLLHAVVSVVAIASEVPVRIVNEHDVFVLIECELNADRPSVIGAIHSNLLVPERFVEHIHLPTYRLHGNLACSVCGVYYVHGYLERDTEVRGNFLLHLV